MTRLRRDLLARALRHFGLVDRFELTELVAAEALLLPSEAAIARRLARFPEALPPGVTAAALAHHVVEELARGEPTATSVGHAATNGVNLPLTAADGAALSAIPKGRGKAAGRYHDQIFRILVGVFAGRLADARKERPQFQGRKRSDIIFRVANRTGFFAELDGHAIHAPYLPVECKNYSGDPDNPEFDQLSGRLNERIGMLGIMTVRRVDDRARLDAHRVDRRNAKREWIIVLDDDDILAMLTAHLRGGTHGVDAVMRTRFETLLFD